MKAQENVRRWSRRQFVSGGVVAGTTGLLTGLPSAATAAAEAISTTAAVAKVRYAELLPRDFRRRLAERPIAYLPLGTLDWHGEHLPLGADALQSEALMVECARQMGGIVLPPIHLGPDRAKSTTDGRLLVGMDYAETTKPEQALAGSCYWIPMGLHIQIVDAILEQLKRAGFSAVFADGHGPSRWSWAENLKEREARFGLKLFGVTSEVAKEWKSQMDHAARNETSLMMHYRPELVDLAQLPAARSDWPQGVGGEDPRDATAAYGKQCLQASVELVRCLFTRAGLL